MKADIKAKWLRALRSGQYNQTKGHLSDDFGFCCLGVLCDIANPDGWTGPLANEINGAVTHALGDENELGVAARHKFGISKEQAEELMTRNDGSRGQLQHNFSQIADYIEKTL